ncbi:unnamed protein product [Phytophthora lilii]|uniref:Unnamed protein product n=1 Tax=Phytophthora lilii TaxID=2077276 RepID=A0A9W6TMA6_9STRA|nr:unnamed protein product [Phytophthora lilii]
MATSSFDKCEYAPRNPVTWHHDKHDSNGFCQAMKLYYANHGNLKSLKWMLENCNAQTAAEVMDGAASNGHLDIVKWLHEHPPNDCSIGRSSASLARFWNCAREQCTTAAMDGAAINGHLNVVKWLHKNREEGCTTLAMDGAARNGHFSLVMWLHCNRREGCSTAAMDGAATNGFMIVVDWLHKNRSEGCTDAALINAATEGYLDIVKYLHVNLKQKATNAAISAAASNGHLPIVQYLHENHSEQCTADAIAQAKKNGHDTVVTFLLVHEECRGAYDQQRLLSEKKQLDDVATPQEFSSTALERTTNDQDAELETRIRAEVEAAIRFEEEARIRAEVETAIQAEQEEALMRARIRAEIQAEVEAKMRDEIRAELLAEKNTQPSEYIMHQSRDVLLLVSLVALVGATITASATPPPVKMVNSNPILEIIVDGAPTRLILTTVDNARKRLHYELHWVAPEFREERVQVPALEYSGYVTIGFFELENQEMRMAAVAYYLGSLGANGFIGAGFAFRPDQSPLWETIEEAAANSHSYLYHGFDHSKKKRVVQLDTSEIKLAEGNDFAEAISSDDYVWSEQFVTLDNGENGISNAQGISFPRWIGLKLDSRLGLSEVDAPASSLPDLGFSLSFSGTELALPLQSLVLPELSESSNDGNSTKVCIQRSASMVQRGTAAFAATTTTAAEVARLQRLHGATGIPVYNMIDTPIIFGAMVLDALESVVFDGASKTTGIQKLLRKNRSRQVTCLKPVSCLEHQHFVSHLNACQGTAYWYTTLFVLLM